MLSKPNIFSSYLIIVVLPCSINADTVTLQCPFQSNLIGEDEIDRFAVVNLNEGDTVTIPCCQRYHAERYWYRIDRFFKQNETEIDPGVMRFSDNYDLSFEVSNNTITGIYYCRDRSLNPDIYYYIIDINEESAPVVYGDHAFLQEFTAAQIEPLAKHVENYLDNKELNNFYKNTGVILTINIRWEEWSECDACQNEKKRRGHCQLQPKHIDSNLCQENCERYKFIFYIDCLSTWNLKPILPELNEKLKNVPNIVRSAKCIGFCSTELIPGIEIYRKRVKLYNLPVGTSLKLICPKHTVKKDCFWRRDGNRMYSSVYNPTDVVSVNEFCVLYLRKVTLEESGNYTCYVNKEMIAQNRILVMEIFSEKHASWWRHIKYLRYIALFCFVILVGGLAMAVVQYRNFQTIDVDEAMEKYLKRKFDHEKLAPPDPEKFYK